MYTSKYMDTHIHKCFRKCLPSDNAIRANSSCEMLVQAFIQQLGNVLFVSLSFQGTRSQDYGVSVAPSVLRVQTHKS